MSSAPARWKPRRVHADAWARSLQAGGAAPADRGPPPGRHLQLVPVSDRRRPAHRVTARAHPPSEDPRPGETPGLTRGKLRRLLAAAREDDSKRSIALLKLLAHTGLRIDKALSRDVQHLA